MTVRDYSTTPASNNAAPPNGAPEGMAASGVNDCIRQDMAEVRESFEELPYFDWGDDPTRIDNTNFSVATDLTARYAVGCRVKLVGATTGFGRITVSAFGSVTTVTVVMDSGNVPTSLVRVAVTPVETIGTSTTVTATITTANITTLNASGVNTFSRTSLFTDPSFVLSSSLPYIEWKETDAAANNQRWANYVAGEQMNFQIMNDAGSSNAAWLTVDRTGAVVDRVAFPTIAGDAPFLVGSAAGVTGSTLAQMRQTTASGKALSIASPTAATATLHVSNEATAGNNVFVEFYTEGISSSLRGSISYNRGGGLVAYNTTSDQRLKDNIRDSLSALGLLSNIRVRAFDWKNMPGSAQRYWLVAQEVALVMPEAVSIPEREADSWSIDVSKLVPLTIKGVQELQAQVQALTARVAALEGGVTEVKPR